MISQAGIRANALKLLSGVACIGVFCALAAVSYFGIAGHRESPIAQLSEPLTTGSITPAPAPLPAPVAEAAPKAEPAPAALADLDSAGLASLIGSGAVKPAPAPKKAAAPARPAPPEKVARR